MLVFYHGGIMFDGDAGWTPGAIVMVVFVFVAPFVYDALQKSGLGKDPEGLRRAWPSRWWRSWPADGRWARLQLPRLNIHLGAMFGTIMAFNVWFRIWPAQQKIITAVKDGHGARRRARVPGRHALAPQRLHVRAARLGR